jgi:hypothetical protein
MTTDNEAASESAGCNYLDKLGRNWRLEFTYGIAKRIMAETKLDFVNAHDGKALQAIAANDHLFVSVLQALCRQQMDDLGVSDEQWAEGIDGPTLGRAIDALEIAVLNFTPPARRPVMAAILDRAREVAEKTVSAVEQKIRSEKVDRLLQRNLKQVDQKLDRDLERIETFGLSVPK